MSYIIKELKIQKFHFMDRSSIAIYYCKGKYIIVTGNVI